MKKIKVLLAFPMEDKQTGLSLKRALINCDCELEICDAKVEPQTLWKKTIKFKPNMILCSRTPALLQQVLMIKSSCHEIFIVCWNVDVRRSIRHFGDVLLTLFRTVDMTVTVSKGNVNEYKELCPNTKILWLTQGVDTVSYHKEKLTKEDHNKYNCDIMFAGSTTNIHKGRIELINYLMSKKDINFKLFGNRVDNKIFDFEHNKACQCTKICLSQNGFADIPASLSVRIFKIIGAGGFCLLEDTKNIEDIFIPGKEIVVYKNKKECYDKIKYYLEHEDERKQIAKNGYERCIKEHTYTEKIKKLLNIIKGI